MSSDDPGRWLWAPGMARPAPLTIEAARALVPEGHLDVVQTLVRRVPMARSGSLRAWRHWLWADPLTPAGVAHLSAQGRLVAELIGGWQVGIAYKDLLGERVESPTLYRWTPDSPLTKLADRFDDRLYHTGKMVLRHGADPGFFGMLTSRPLTHKQLPLRVFEMGKGFRRSQPGELRGIERLAEFDILEHHTLLEAGAGPAEYQRQLSVQFDRHEAFAGIPVCHFRTTEPASALAASTVLRLAAERAPTVIETLPAHTNYWSLTHTFYTADGISTFHSQLDLLNARRFSVRVPGAAELAIIHTALGSIQHMMLVAESRGLARQPNLLPVWLTPVQVRLIPVASSFSPACRQLRGLLGDDVRADIDDRPRSVGWRVRRAAQEWVPYTIIVGADESAGELRVRLRDGTVTQTDASTLAGWIAADGKGYPRAPLGYELVSRRAPLNLRLD